MKAHYANMRTCWYCCGAQKNWVAWYAFLLVIVLVPAYVYGEIEIGALAAMMEAKNRAVSADYAKSLKFTVSVRPVYHFPRSNMPPMLRDGFETAWRMCTFAFEGEKRYLRMQEGRANGLQNSEWQHEYVEVWTTQEALKYYPSERFGEIYPGDGDEPRGGMRFQRTPSPFDFAGLHDSVDGMYGVSFHLPAMLNSPDARVLPGIITLDDSECIVIATPSGEPLYWLDVNRGYIPKKALVSRLSVDGVSEKRIYNESFQEVSPGLWAVTKARIEWVGPLPGSSQSDDRQLVILADIIYEYSDIVFNEPLADGQFGTPWPDGTVVADFRLGDPVEPYVWGKGISNMDMRALQEEISLTVNALSPNTTSEGATPDEASNIAPSAKDADEVSIPPGILLAFAAFPVTTIAITGVWLLLRRRQKCS